jgi:hypothetical protein
MRTLLSLLIILGTVARAEAQGFGDWDRNTPYGSRMYDPGSGTKLVFGPDHREIDGVGRWYFYRGCTIGTYGKQYFIADERNARFESFDSEQTWENALTLRQLKPTWTRWYEDDWCFFDNLAWLMLLGFYVTIPLLAVFGVVAFRAIVREHLHPGKPYTLVLMGVTLLVTIQYVLDKNPVSL